MQLLTIKAKRLFNDALRRGGLEIHQVDYLISRKVLEVVRQFMQDGLGEAEVVHTLDEFVKMISRN